MKIIDFLNNRSRKLSIFDWKLAQGAAMCIAIIAVKMNPTLLDINIWWLVGIAAALYIKPLYTFYVKQ